jgi:hypothetical protein
MTTNYDELRLNYAHVSPEERLKVLRLELLRPIVTVQSVAELLKEIDSEGINQLPDHARPEEFNRLVEWLIQAGEDLKGILDALTKDIGPG